VDRLAYTKSSKYTDWNTIYSECSGPGGLQLTEFLAEKMRLSAGARLLDIGIEHGYQTCFLAKEYDVWVIGIDPDEGLPLKKRILSREIKRSLQ
jgi:cyclopropane fatty-acyl-phospholipid synthase-like methyltransferase